MGNFLNLIRPASNEKFDFTGLDPIISFEQYTLPFAKVGCEACGARSPNGCSINKRLLAECFHSPLERLWLNCRQRRSLSLCPNDRRQPYIALLEDSPGSPI